MKLALAVCSDLCYVALQAYIICSPILAPTFLYFIWFFYIILAKCLFYFLADSCSDKGSSAVVKTSTNQLVKVVI